MSDARVRYIDGYVVRLAELDESWHFVISREMGGKVLHLGAGETEDEALTAVSEWTKKHPLREEQTP